MDYQEESRATWRAVPVSSQETGIDVYCLLGLGSEVGELQGKVKKIFRDKGGRLCEHDIEEIKQELGDILWYLTQIATNFGLTLEEIMGANIGKLADRAKRGVIGGSGDKR